MNQCACAQAFTATLLFSCAVALHAQLPPSLSATPPAQEQPSPEAPALQLHVREVLIPVVVRDAEGHAVGDLKKDNFKVFDQGKQRKIVGFSLQQSPVSAGSPPPVAQAVTPASNGSPASSAVQSVPAEQRSITFLFDDRHLGPTDLDQVKKAGMQMLDAPLPDSDRGLVLSFLGVNSGLTHNHAVLQAAVMKLKVQQVFRPNQHQCPDIDYYAADQILNKHNDSEFKIGIEKAAACTHSTNMDIMRQLVETNAMESLQSGDQDARETLIYLRDVVHTISALPGQRTLILISPGFASASSDALTLQSQVLDLAAASHVTISTLDARGLFSGQMLASQGGSGSVVGDMTGQAMQNHSESMRENEDIMAELADGTGGSFFHNSNDLQGGLKTLAAAPEYLYTLDVSLQDLKPNGAYHPLKVEVDRKDLKVQARHGYFAPFPPRNK